MEVGEEKDRSISTSFGTRIKSQKNKRKTHSGCNLLGCLR